LEIILAGKEQDKPRRAKQCDRLNLLIQCIGAEKDCETKLCHSACEPFLLKCFAARDRLSALKVGAGGEEIVNRVVGLMVWGSPTLQKTLATAHASLTAEQLDNAFTAARRSLCPAEVFEGFSPYLTATTAKRSRDKSAAARRETIHEALVAPLLVQQVFTRFLDGIVVGADNQDLDPRWLDLAIERADHQLTLACVSPGNSKANQRIQELFDAAIAGPEGPGDVEVILAAMIRAEHPNVTACMVRAISKFAKAEREPSLFFVGRLIPALPKEAAPQLEELLPMLPEKAVDRLLGYLTELKNRT
jgi:hypothetical protein